MEHGNYQATATVNTAFVEKQGTGRSMVMLQAVSVLMSMFLGAIAAGVIWNMLSEERDSIRAALGLSPSAQSFAPLPPRFREVTVRRSQALRLTPPARVRVAF